MFENLEAELRLRSFSENTVKAYTRANQGFLGFIKKEPAVCNQDDVKRYLGFLISKRKLSQSSISLVKAGLTFYLDELLKLNICGFKSPRSSKKLPVVLSKEEVKRLILSPRKEKHKLMIELLYSSGLRVSELTNLRLKDVELSERIGWVRAGKGAKDRLFILSELIANHLTEYLAKLPPKNYLFETKTGKYSDRAIQRVLTNAAKNASINKRVTPHTMRHSFATHLLEAGVDIRKIQELLGHSNLQTTQIYTKVSSEQLKKVKSPLDSL